MSTVDGYDAIRRACRGGKSIRQIARGIRSLANHHQGGFSSIPTPPQQLAITLRSPDEPR